MDIMISFDILTTRYLSLSLSQHKINHKINGIMPGARQGVKVDVGGWVLLLHCALVRWSIRDGT